MDFKVGDRVLVKDTKENGFKGEDDIWEGNITKIIEHDGNKSAWILEEVFNGKFLRVLTHIEKTLNHGQVAER